MKKILTTLTLIGALTMTTAQKFETKKEFIDHITPIIGKLKRNTSFASYDEHKQALKLKEENGRKM